MKRTLNLPANLIAGQGKFEIGLDKLGQTWYNILMRNRNEKGNTMATIDFEHGLTENVDAEDTHNTTWSECECEACTSETETKGFENHQGDGPSGYDYFSDTRRWC